MYKRDLAVIVISFFALFLVLQDQSVVTFRKAWYYEFKKDALNLSPTAWEDLPAPVVADLNGDGLLEVIVATHDMKLQLLQPAPPGRAGEGFAPAKVVADVSLLPKKVSIGLDRQPVAMAVGYLDPAPLEAVVAPRRQVLVVVTAGLQVLVMDHNLKLMWESDVEDKMPPGARLAEVAIFVSPHRVHAADRGMVVVGASIELGDVKAAEAGEAAGSGTNSLLQGILKEEERLEAEQAQHAHSAAKGKLQEAGGKLKEGGNVAGVDASRHFSYFAFEGASGTSLWSHTSSSFKRDLEQDAEELQPQHNFRLDAEKLNERHFGETSCRDFRASILAALPHTWAGRRDTLLQPALFVRHREGSGQQRQHLADRAEHKATAAAGHKPVHRTPLLSRSSRRQQPPPGPHQGSAPGAGPAPQQPNALVAHLQEGLEAIHLYTGRPLCSLHLPEDALHVDLNEDGVIDHVRVASGGEKAFLGGLSSISHAYLGPCMATATSGVPPRHHLWVANVCAQHRGLADAVKGKEMEGDPDSKVEFLPAVFLPVPRADGTYAYARGPQHGLVVIAGSDGSLGAYNAHGHKLWQSFYGTDWDPTVSRPAVPSLLPLALRPHMLPAGVLLVGERLAVVVSEHGNVLADLDIASPPVQPAVVADFNGDGLNDLILVTADGVFGWAQMQHLGGISFGALVLTLILAMGVVYFTQQYGSGQDTNARAARKLRSTEYVD